MLTTYVLNFGPESLSSNKRDKSCNGKKSPRQNGRQNMSTPCLSLVTTLVSERPEEQVLLRFRQSLTSGCVTICTLYGVQITLLCWLE